MSEQSALHRLATFQFFRPVTGGAFLRRWLVEQHHLCVDGLHQFVATLAAHIAVHALQWERRLLVVVEQ